MATSGRVQVEPGALGGGEQFGASRGEGTQCVFAVRQKTSCGIAGDGSDTGNAGGMADSTHDDSQKAAARLGRVSRGEM